ncbi:hypothetical protein NSND_63021 [Nitrospira sp. ND1]|nr:hypothetical protein NSND_63021 [Nitrospira sp. ND1]
MSAVSGQNGGLFRSGSEEGNSPGERCGEVAQLNSQSVAGFQDR